MWHRRRANRRGRGAQTAAGLRLAVARLRREGSQPQQAVRAVAEAERRRRLAHHRRAAARSRGRRRGGRTAEGSREADYARSVAVTKEVINSIRMGRTANVK